jgi:hypothetical protein
MASRMMQQTQAAHARRAEDTAKAAELAERFPGWTVFSSRDARTRVATRSANQQPPDGDDDTWAATLLADSWTDLELQLKEQVQHDAELTYQTRA